MEIEHILDKLNEGFKHFFNNGTMFDDNIVLLKLPTILAQTSYIDGERTVSNTIEVNVPYESEHLLEIFAEVIIHHIDIGVSIINVKDYSINYDINTFSGGITDAMVAIHLNGLNAAEKMGINKKRNINTKLVIEILKIDNCLPEILYRGKYLEDEEFYDIKPIHNANKIAVKY